MMRKTWERDIFDDYDEAMERAWNLAWGQEEEEVQDSWTEEEVLRAVVNDRLQELQAVMTGLIEKLRATVNLEPEEEEALANAWHEIDNILQERA